LAALAWNGEGRPVPAADRAQNDAAGFEPQEVARVGGRSLDVAVREPYVFLGSGHQVLVLDASGPGLPTRVGASPSLGHMVRSLAVHDDRLFAALGAGGVRALDLRDPPTLAPLSADLSDAGPADALLLEGNWLFVHDEGAQTISILDISDRSEARRLGQIPARKWAAFDVDDHLLALTYFDFYGYLELYDLSDPSTPERLAKRTIEGEPCGPAFAAGRLLVAYTTGGLGAVWDPHWRVEAYDLGSPREPRLHSVARSPEIFEQGCVAFAADDERAYANIGQDYTWVSNLYVIHHGAAGMSIGGSLRLEAAQTMELFGSRLYLPEPVGGGLHAVSLADRDRPSRLGTLDTPGHVVAVSSGNVVSLVDAWPPSRRRLYTVNVTDPAAPVLLASVDTEARWVRSSGEIAYAIADHSVDIYNTGDGRLALSGRLATPDEHITSVANGDGTLYAAFEDGPARAFDVRDPSAPRDVMSFPELVGYPMQLGLVGSSLYAITSTVRDRWPATDALWLADAATGTATARLGLGYRAGFTATDGDHLYLRTEYPDRVEVIDVQDRTQPRPIASVPMPCCGASAIAYRNGRLYALAGRSLVAVDVSDPSTPRALGEHLLFPPGRDEWHGLASSTQSLALGADLATGETLVFVGTLHDGLIVLRDGDAPEGGPSRQRIFLPAALAGP
jgi:hypothetical protein